MIEGVNTAARTVLIYDKTINIKGRAGRLGEHRVGKVFLFNAPPEHTEVEVAPTLFAEEEDAPEDYIVHLDPPPGSAPDARVELLQRQLGLSANDLRAAASVGLETAAAIRVAVSRALQEGKDIAWTGHPKYRQIEAVINVVCEVKKASDFGAYTASQLTYFINSLRISKTFQAFLADYDSKYKGQPHTHDNVFRFLRSCEYGLSQAVAVVELFVRQLRPEADYSVFLHGLTRWFLPEELKNLDEEGIPVQISERFWRSGDSRATLLNRIERAALSGDLLSRFEQRWLHAALEIES